MMQRYLGVKGHELEQWEYCCFFDAIRAGPSEVSNNCDCLNSEDELDSLSDISCPRRSESQSLGSWCS